MVTPKHAGQRLDWLTPQVRRYIYAVTTAVVPLLVVYGVLDEHTAPLWLALAAQVTATATAYVHTPAVTPQPPATMEVER